MFRLPWRAWYENSGHFVAALYVVFSLTDMLLSLTAFSLGIPEGNPLLASLTRYGLFVPAKLFLTLLVAVLIMVLYSRRRARSLAWSGLLAMVGVDMYHLWSLSALTRMG